MDGFQEVSLRDESGSFLESYTSYIRRVRTTIATIVLATATIAVYVFAFGYQLYIAGVPTRVNAYSTTIDIYPTWDETEARYDVYNDNFGGGCQIDTSYSCGAFPLGDMYGRLGNPPGDCSGLFDFSVESYRSALQFPLSSIPNNATITSVTLHATVQDTSTQVITIGRIASDTPSSAYSCNTGDLYNAVGSHTPYTTTTWNTTGDKTLLLGASAATDVQTRLTGSDTIGLSLKTAEAATNPGGIWSVDWTTPSQRPFLRIAYTLPPQTPTGFAASNQTTTSIDWSWTDNATAETRYDVHDQSHATVTGCTNLAANTASCTETGLSANTSYTRHAYVTDPNGATDSGTDTHTTAQNTPTGIMPMTSFSTSLKVSATGTLPSIAVGSSGLYFEETTTSQNSGWIQVNEWTLTGLQPNTEYTFRVKARNQEGVETAFSPTGTNMTGAASPAVTADRSYGVWHNTPTIVFTNLEPWGAGGVEEYKYAFTNSATYSHTGLEPSWSGSTLTQSASADGASWYLHLAAYDQNLDIPSGGESSFGPFRYDGTAPTLPNAVIDGTTTDLDTQSSTSTMVGTWSAASDPTAGVAEYEYAIGTTPGGSNVRSWTSTGTLTSVTASGLTLSAGATYYLSVRATDNAGNLSSVRTADGVTIEGGEEPVTTTITGITITTTTTSATINWTTNEVATGQVEYGLTTSYGTTTTESGTDTAHTVVLTGLTANTTYHYRLTSVGTTTATTADATFTTESVEVLPPAPVTATKRPRLNPPDVTSPSTGSIKISGVAHGGQSVVFRLDGRIVGRVVQSGSSTIKKSYSLTVTIGPLSVGTHRLTARANNGSGVLSRIVTQRFTIYEAESRPSSYVGTYVVQAGDSLWSIAEQFLGNGAQYNVLMFANADAHPELLTNPSLVQPGWVITIPPG